ncbi:pentatricopeptide repeat-containing protein At2g17033 [Malania oleifera]|uniref:pentatricopeptide repeat-containing protein At2g17033 n=1 Tax=Malania oleifera TaxID=397392 RepID=UPI0025AE42A3|nr:pentatricopeptide repeat-containing protein At2g17033 [Malania oleifera]
MAAVVVVTQLLCRPPSWNAGRPPAAVRLTTKCSLSKQGQRFLSSLAIAADDDAAANRLICKFVASSPKSVALNALSHLLSPATAHPHLSSLALPLYCRITEASWFSYNPKLVADVVALLYQHHRLNEAETLVYEAVSKLGDRERDLALFYCTLIDSHSKQGSKRGFFDSYERLKQLASSSSSVYVKQRAFESIVKCLCVLDLPREAESVMKEMRSSGLKTSVFEFRSVVHAYGKLGFFEDMNRIISQMENEGFAMDTICSNMILSSYGVHNRQSEMVKQLRRMKDSGIPFSIRTYNSALNSCQAMSLKLQYPKNLPLSIEQLVETLNGGEAMLVRELVDSSVLADAMEWNSSEAKLDLHGMHLGCAYLVILQWVEEARRRFRSGKWMVPAEVTVVCGSGKHSVVRGESPVKGLVREMMVRMKSPMRIDRKNIGCFVARGEVVKQWLC